MSIFSYFLTASVLLSSVIGFQIPGISLKEFVNNSPVDIKVSELTSTMTQIPYPYYYLIFCEPDKLIQYHETLGSIILGDKLQNSVYSFQFNKNETCVKSCQLNLGEKLIDRFKWMIDNDYRAVYHADSLPNLYQMYDKNQDQGFFEIGVPIGFKENGLYYLYNHLRFIVHYHPIEGRKQNQSNIVGFFVQPKSIHYEVQNVESAEKMEYQPGCVNDFEVYAYQPLEVGKVVFSYKVEFEWCPKEIGFRWDHYQIPGDEKIHWFSIINSLVILLILSFMCIIVMKRILGKQISEMSQLASTMDMIQDQGWKQVQRDVFRPPKFPLVLGVMSGVGVQLLILYLSLLTFIGIGFHHQGFRGEIFESGLYMFSFSSFFVGYISAILYKMNNGENWLKLIVVSGLFFPFICFIVLMGINFFLVLEQSSGAVDIVTLVELFGIWFGISLPMNVIGCVSGFKKEKIKCVVQYVPVPNKIPPQPFIAKNILLVPLGGLLPFMAVMIELSFVMGSIWRHSYYYLFALLIIIFFVLIISCAEVSIVITYITLCKWWWKSFISSGFCGVFIFLFSLLYYLSQLHINRFSSTILYFGIMGLFSFTIFLLCGTIGYIASLIFVRKIYSLIQFE